MKRFSTLIISLSDSISSWLLDNPYMFNYIRYLLAGRQKRMKKFIETYLDEYDCKTVADICAGTGDFAELVATNAKYVGLDINDDFINFARKRYRDDKNKNFVKANILKRNKYTNSKYDCVMLISTVHHFSDEDLEILLPMVKRMTKKVVIIADIIPDAPHALQRFFARIDRGKFVRTKSEKVKILSKYFKVIKTQPIPTRTAVQMGIICVPK